MAFFASSNANHHVWETISVEFEGPFTQTPVGNQFIVVLTDLYSKWVEAKAVTEKTSSDVANFVLSTFSRMGFCDCKFFNMDPEFEREVRLSIHTLGSPFVQNVEKFKTILDRVIEDTPSKDGEFRGDTRQYGYHTEMIINWIEENSNTWDTYLEGFLFKLRMGDVNDLENVSASPFSIIYGRMNSDDKGGKGGNQGGSWKRGRGRPRAKFRGRNRWSNKPVVNASKDESSEEEANKVTSESTDETPTLKRKPGRPRKLKPALPENDENKEGENCEQTENVESNPMKSKRGRPRKENVVNTDSESVLEDPEKPEVLVCPDKKYGLRTRLKAKVKTNIVKRMLKMSAHKRSLPSDIQTDISFATLNKFKTPSLKLQDQSNKAKRKIKKNVINDDSKFILSSMLELENIEKQLQVGEASIINEAGEVTVVKLISNMIPVIDEQTAATLSIQPQQHDDEADSDEDGDDIEEDDEYVEDEDNIDDLEEEDDIENDDDDDEVRTNGEDNESDAGEEGLRVPCSNCPGLFLGEKESILHAQFHKDGSKLLHCLYCTDVTGTWEHMQNHLLAHIDNNSAPGAATMLKKLKGSRAAALSCRRLRRKELAGTTSIKCPLCPNVRMATHSEEEIHQSCHREDSRLLRCPHCDHVSGSWPQMQVHLAVHPEVPIESYAVPIEERTCSKCFKVFATSEMVVEHQYIFHVEQRKFQCEMCGKVFKERKSMARHKEIHANIIYKCGDCTYKTKIHQDLVDHQRIHQGLGFKCNLCDKVFVRQAQLHNHQEVHNKDQSVVICDQCGYQAHGLVALRYHHRDAHGVPQSFPCPQCDYVGKTKSNLKGHTDRIHNKQYKCPHCVFACLAECTLLRHIDIFHNEEDRKYPCYHCPYRARDPKCLTEHVRVLHNPQAQKIPCEFCGMEFKTKSMLRDHLPQHTGQRFICRLCDYVAKYRSILYRHVKKRHPGHTLASVTRSTEPLIKQTPDGKPILPTRTRGPPRKTLQPTMTNVQRKICPITTTTIATTTSEEMTSDPESQTTTLTIVASDNEHNMLDPDSDMMKEADGGSSGGGGMYIATMEDGETLTVDENSIVLDASLLAQAAAGGGSITINNNMCLQIIQNNADGEDITMQVIPSMQNDGEGSDKPVELLLFASEEA